MDLCWPNTNEITIFILNKFELKLYVLKELEFVFWIWVYLNLSYIFSTNLNSVFQMETN